jgi:hypothetical protein
MGTRASRTSPRPGSICTAPHHLSRILESPSTSHHPIFHRLPAAGLFAVGGALLAPARSLSRRHQPSAPAGAHWQPAAGLARPPEPGGDRPALAPRAPGRPAAAPLRAGAGRLERPQGCLQPLRSAAAPCARPGRLGPG